MAQNFNGFGTMARMLHWLVAACILLMIAAGVVMVRDGLPRAVQDVLFLFHKNVGVALILIIAFRIFWRLRHPAPELPQHMPRWQKRVAGWSHLSLYVLMVVMPISGYIRVRAGGFPIESLDAAAIPTLIPKNKALADAASQVHELAGYGLMAVLALHIGAALFHAVIRGDGIWGRMWPPRRAE
jgi:cytochrome b561